MPRSKPITTTCAWGAFSTAMISKPSCSNGIRRPSSPIIRTLVPRGNFCATACATACDEVITCHISTSTPKSFRPATYCSEVFVLLLVAKTNFNPRSRMRLNMAGRSPIGASPFQITPSMSMMRDLMGEGIINNVSVLFYKLLHQIFQHRTINPLGLGVSAFFEVFVAHKLVESIRESFSIFQVAFLSKNFFHLLEWFTFQFHALTFWTLPKIQIMHFE